MRLDYVGDEPPALLLSRIHPYVGRTNSSAWRHCAAGTWWLKELRLDDGGVRMYAELEPASPRISGMDVGEHRPSCDFNAVFPAREWKTYHDTIRELDKILSETNRKT